jgi:hypothetical protein
VTLPDEEADEDDEGEVEDEEEEDEDDDDEDDEHAPRTAAKTISTTKRRTATPFCRLRLSRIISMKIVDNAAGKQPGVSLRAWPSRRSCSTRARRSCST